MNNSLLSTSESRIAQGDPAPFTVAVEQVESTLPDRFEVRTGERSKRIVVEPMETRYGMLLDYEILSRIERRGFKFEATAAHKGKSYANHWFRYTGE